MTMFLDYIFFKCANLKTREHVDAKQVHMGYSTWTVG